MKQQLIFVICCIVALAGLASAQTVIIADFPVGVGGSVDRSVFTPYQSDLREVADTLKAYPLARAIITGGADGHEYRGVHDAKNPGLALGRAHILRNLLINEYGADSLQLVIQSEDIAIKGGIHRYASVRVDRTLADLASRLDALEKRPPVEKHITEIREVPVESNPFADLGLLFGLGVSSSPYGAVPMASAAVSWKHIVYVEGFVGHTFWNNEFEWEKAMLDTKRRFIGGQVIVFPLERIPLGLVGGWVRQEEVSQQHYEYVKMSEGPVVGLRAMPVPFISATATWNPVKQRLSGRELSNSDTGQFEISFAAHLAIGGAK